MLKKIAIQGHKACFHEIALANYYGVNTSAVYCNSFIEVFDTVAQTNDIHGGVIAIENSIAGSILPNYKLLINSGLNITGEIYLQIHQHLMVLPGTGMKDIREIHSHPMALQQCLSFLETLNVKLVETEDTALSARLLSQTSSSHIAVIASELAATTYGLQIIRPNIHDNPFNYTRFLIVQRTADLSSRSNKASIVFSTENEPGCLSKILIDIAKNNLNISKLQSFPDTTKFSTRQARWSYYFHADLEFNDIQDFHKVMEELTSSHDPNLRILGLYESGFTKAQQMAGSMMEEISG